MNATADIGRAWVRNYYERNQWRCSVSCPMYSVVRDECIVIADAKPASECPGFQQKETANA